MKQVLTVCFLMLACGLCFAQGKDLIINAAALSYDKEKGVVEATGSVEAVYQKIKITGDHLIYRTASREVYLDSGFDFKYDDLNFSGKTLKYNLSAEAGSATMVAMKYENANIYGGEVKFNREEIKLKNSGFEKCGLTPPHYHLSAAEIDLFQKQGWLVAYWGIFWLGSFPSIPIPVYVYDFRAEQKGRKNVMPYPEIGTNNEDGLWIRETMSWHSRPDLYGNYSVNYAGRKGIGVGFNVNYIMSEDRESEGDIFLSMAEGPRGGLEYRQNFGKEINENSTLTGLSFNPYKQFEFDARLWVRERINYERVSLLPDLSLIMRKAQFSGGWVEGSVSIGNVAEESSNVFLIRENIYANYSYPLTENITPGLAADASLYGSIAHWFKLQGIIDYSKKLNENLESQIEYSHYFENRGQSPFNYERYRFNSRDKIGLQLLSKLLGGRFIFNCSYILPALEPLDIDYTIGKTLHCFNIDLTYRAMRQEFTLGFSLN
jgi:LPS-assembly protein